MSASYVYMTTSDTAEALRIGRALVEERLVACVNVLEGMTSLYWWQGKVEEGHEAVLVGKTKTSLVDAVIARVKALHSYACPCVVSWPIERGSADYLQWINDETQ